jgi:hypothetical protein
MNFVFRDEVNPDYTTDVTIEVRDIIKGKPNVQDRLIRFMILGGTGIHPRTGEDLTCDVSVSPKFKINEKVLLFLKKNPRLPYSGIHDGLYPIGGAYGKMGVINNSVHFPYTYEETITYSLDGRAMTKVINNHRIVELPLELVVKLARASIIDPGALKALELRYQTLLH